MVKSTLRHPLASIFECLAISWQFLAIFVTKMAKNGHFCSCTKLLHVGTLNLCQKMPEMMPWNYVNIIVHLKENVQNVRNPTELDVFSLCLVHLRVTVRHQGLNFAPKFMRDVQKYI